MLKINKKIIISVGCMVVGFGGMFLYKNLTWVPEYSFAKAVETPIYGDRVDTRTLSEITYMQEMTGGVCSRSEKMASNRLIDERDGKYYWVTKLIGDVGDSASECWMTQNLDYDITKNGLSSSTSDLDISEWIPKEGEITIISADTVLSSDIWGNSDGDIRSYDPGNYVYTQPTIATNSCSSSKGLQECTSKGWQLVDKPWAPSEDSNFSKIIDDDNKVYNAHYLAGNYYSWAAATAGQAGDLVNSVSGEESTRSVCPKNWRLPFVGGERNSYNVLFSSYGNNSGLKYGNQDIRLSPLSFVYGGYVGSGSLYGAGSNGQYWTSTSYSKTHAWFLSFDRSKVNTYNAANGRSRGYSVRCVARNEVPDVKIPEIDNPDISVTVPRVITLDVSKSVEIATGTDKISTGEFVADVTSNSDYTLSLNAAEAGKEATSLVNMKDGRKIGEIEAISGGEQPSIGVSKWGIRKCGETCTGDYRGLSELGVSNTFAEGTAGTNKRTRFEVGIGIGPELPSGTYGTTIIVTASQK